MKFKFFVALLCLSIICKTSFSQQVNGKWYGVGNVYMDGENNDYLSELLLQQNGNKVSGVYNYFFKDKHISNQIKGTYYPESRLLVLHSLPLLNYSAKNLNNADCSMVGSFTLKISKLDATLTGAFTPTNQYRFTCPDILIKLKKSDAEGIMASAMQKKPLILEEGPPVVAVEPLQMKLQKKEPLVDLNKRIFKSKEIEVSSDSISVSLYDNSEIDFDTVSLFYNKKLVAYKQMLSDKPINFRFRIDSLEEISMYAENLGKLPPNTAMMVVYDGGVRHEIPITSDYMENGTVRFRRVKVKN